MATIYGSAKEVRSVQSNIKFLLNYLFKCNEKKIVLHVFRETFKLNMFSLQIFSDKEGQAMLKFRDEVDYKALSQLGLIEPVDDEVRSQELGYPEHPTAAGKALLVHGGEDVQPIPMMLGGTFIANQLPGGPIMQPTRKQLNTYRLALNCR